MNYYNYVIEATDNDSNGQWNGKYVIDCHVRGSKDSYLTLPHVFPTLQRAQWAVDILNMYGDSSDSLRRNKEHIVEQLEICAE